MQINGDRDRHKHQNPGKNNFIKLVELIRIRKESSIFSWENQPSSWVNWGKRKEQRVLESTSKKSTKGKVKQNKTHKQTNKQTKT